ncbi:MAG TPA: response regulator transcription factor, partial [Bacteroidales bacterium]|nr:response regulator transcription factor [Bacteroidales bacterium]
MENRNKILIVDDDSDIREFLSYNLGRECYEVHCAANGIEAIQKAGQTNPDLILLDIMMPGADGIEVCQQLRELPEMNRVIIVFLTARSEDYSQIAGFDAGADDYITKPVKPKIIVKKIESLLRHHNRLLNDLKKPEENKNSKFVFNNLSIDIEMHRIEKDGIEILLPKKEFKLLKLLISKPGK